MISAGNFVRIPWLAQATAPAGVPAVEPFDYREWVPTGTEALWGLGWFVGVLLVALVILLLTRKWLTAFRLRLAFAVSAFSVAIYLGAWGLNHERMADPGDPIAFWVHRLFIGAVLFVGLRIMDRIAIIPVLTRRGKIAMPRFIHQIANMVLTVFVLLIYGSMAFGWDIDKFLAGSAVVSIVLGLALQESLGNFFSGLVIQASPPFAIGHRISVGTHEGDVVDMTWRAITLKTDEDDYIIIPNASVATSEIINFSVPTRATARYVKVGLDYDLPPADAIAVLKAAAKETPGVLPSPEPIIYLEEFADSAMVYSIKFWLEDAAEREIIEHGVRVHAWYRLKQRGYSIPFPVRTVEYTSLDRKSRQTKLSARDRRLEAIGQVPLLQPLTEQQKQALADSADEIHLAEGQVLFRQSDVGDSFYIIYKGGVDVLVTPEGSKEERKVVSLGVGDFFGEMSALTGQPRTATIRATASLACVQIEKRDLLPIFQADPALMEKISEIVAKRNAEREAILQGATKTVTAEVMATQQRTLLSRMMRFFRLAA